jgi:acyl carrier protein
MIERVVEQMVPVEWVVVEELPLRGNGKVDAGKLEELRKEARRRDGGAGEGEVERGEVRDEIEEAVWEIWKEVLEEDEVGVDENFFDVGGHSLIAMQVMLRVRERLGVELTVQELFEWPTISLLAQRVRQAQIEQDELLEADELIDEVERLSSEEIQRMLESKRSADG